MSSAYNVVLHHASLPMAEFRTRYQDQARYIGYCQACKNYDHVWSCPSLPFSVADYLAPYQQVEIIAARIDLAPATIAAADPPEKIRTTGYDIVITVKRQLEDLMLDLEPQLPGSRMLSSGGCNRCERCARADKQPCRFPDRMRYSLDSFGFDLSAIAHDLLGIDIEWARDRLPDHFTLVHALLLLKPVEYDWERFLQDTAAKFRN